MWEVGSEKGERGRRVLKEGRDLSGEMIPIWKIGRAYAGANDKITVLCVCFVLWE
jgi:hypothetical protein